GEVTRCPDCPIVLQAHPSQKPKARRACPEQSRGDGPPARLIISWPRDTIQRDMHLIALVLVDFLIRPLFVWPVARVAHAVRELWFSQRTSYWYTAQGTVAGRLATEKRRYWYVRLTYYYMAESEVHLGEWLRFFVFESEVDKFLGRHPDGSQISLRYHPGRASRSVVLDADQQHPILESQPLPE